MSFLFGGGDDGWGFHEEYMYKGWFVKIKGGPSTYIANATNNDDRIRISEESLFRTHKAIESAIDKKQNEKIRN